MLLNAFCNKCGKEVIFDDTKEYMYCWSCGQMISRAVVQNAASHAAPVQPVPVPVQMVPAGMVPSPMPVFNTGPNLMVTYQSNYSGYPMFFRIHTTNEKFNIDPGQTMSFRLNPGRHALFFRLGNKFYRRDVSIVPGNPPIKIDCSWFGRARIDVVQSSSVYP